ncbi:hypothetical protein C5167_011061 [Papaver somniferum]|uniref:Uncharacterized protein n=1 Tax=Papaver somniferum TaxID=3469 RepID=A0A4Y7K365_PAPSO|nr:hypothetical protein C5167_011061 [Papaver somniferum]
MEAKYGKLSPSISLVYDATHGYITEDILIQGDKIRLWEDKRCLKGLLCSLCPRLYHLSSNKNCSLSAAHNVGDEGYG